MNGKRQRYDPLHTNTAPQWLARVDKFNKVIESRKLAPRTDLRAALAAGIEELRRDGWTIEGVSCNGTFVHRAAERHYLGVYPADPGEAPLSLHGKYPGT